MRPGARWDVKGGSQQVPPSLPPFTFSEAQGTSEKRQMPLRVTRG